MVDRYLETHAWLHRTSLMVNPLRDWLMFGPEWVSSYGDSRLLASRVQTSAEVNGIEREAGASRMCSFYACFSFVMKCQVIFILIILGE
jgi:hypothetical protein